jgi:hypothetical protein
MTTVRVAILDDYQNVALECADWDRLDAQVEVFNEHISGVDELVRKLSGFEVIVAMRERARFSAEVLRQGDHLATRRDHGSVEARPVACITRHGRRPVQRKAPPPRGNIESSPATQARDRAPACGISTRPASRTTPLFAKPARDAGP